MKPSLILRFILQIVTQIERRKRKPSALKKLALLVKEGLMTSVKITLGFRFFYAKHTFEVDFIQSSNSDYLKMIVRDVYTQPATVNAATTELSSTDIAISGSRALTMANYQGKGWFALTLSKVIDFKVAIPEYIFDAIKFAHGDFNAELTFKILKHRYESVIEHVKDGLDIIERLDEEGNVSLKQEWEAYLAPYESGLATFTPKWEAFNPLGGDINVLKAQLMNDLPTENNDILTRI